MTVFQAAEEQGHMMDSVTSSVPGTSTVHAACCYRRAFLQMWQPCLNYVFVSSCQSRS